MTTNDESPRILPHGWKLGLHMPNTPSWLDKKDWARIQTESVRPQSVKYYDPLSPPLSIGDTVCCGAIVKPEEIGMTYRVAGLYYSRNGNGWQATLAIGTHPDRTEYLVRSASQLTPI